MTRGGCGNAGFELVSLDVLGPGLDGLDGDESGIDSGDRMPELVCPVESVARGAKIIGGAASGRQNKIIRFDSFLADKSYFPPSRTLDADGLGLEQDIDFQSRETLFQNLDNTGGLVGTREDSTVIFFFQEKSEAVKALHGSVLVEAGDYRIDVFRAGSVVSSSRILRVGQVASSIAGRQQLPADLGVPLDEDHAFSVLRSRDSRHNPGRTGSYNRNLIPFH